MDAATSPGDLSGSGLAIMLVSVASIVVLVVLCYAKLLRGGDGGES